MEGLHTLKDLLKKGDWMTKVDLKDAYFMIPIQQQDRPFLRFSMESQDYQFSCLLFGLSCAPWVFTKTLKPVLTLLRELGVRLVAYIDDILVLAETKEMAQCHTEALMYLLQNLGYIIHPEKTVTQPAQEIEFLGMMVDSRALELRLPGQKIRKLRKEAAMIIKDHQLSQTPPTIREVSRLLGKFNSLSQAVVMGESRNLHSIPILNTSETGIDGIEYRFRDYICACAKPRGINYSNN
uniref:Reverse transcriptase domain-containing protein n=1 Tax=Amphimedon queenslandica TaxID=400682 RepID=A0A1X7SH48_AMPQE